MRLKVVKIELVDIRIQTEGYRKLEKIEAIDVSVKQRLLQIKFRVELSSPVKFIIVRIQNGFQMNNLIGFKGNNVGSFFNRIGVDLFSKLASVDVLIIQQVLR